MSGKPDNPKEIPTWILELLDDFIVEQSPFPERMATLLAFRHQLKAKEEE